MKSPVPPQPMTLARFSALLDAYGGEPARWPLAERDSAQALVRDEPRARQLLAAAQQLDVELDGWQTDELSAQLRARVLEIPIRNPQRAPRRAARALFGMRLTLLAAVPCVLGYLSAPLFNDNPDNDESWNDAPQVSMLSDTPEELLP